MVAVVSDTGRLVFVSASAERLLGYDVSDAVGLDALALFEPASQAAVEDLFDDLVARRRLAVSLEVRCRRADGRELDLELQADNHLDDPVGGILVTLRDISERKRLEARVHEQDRRQHALIESLADGLVMVDRDGTVVRVNEAFEVMFWAPRIRSLGRSFEDAPRGRARPRGRALRRVRARRCRSRSTRCWSPCGGAGGSTGGSSASAPGTGRPAGCGSAPRPSSGRTVG